MQSGNTSYDTPKGTRRFQVLKVDPDDFCNNDVRTARYTLISFLPLFLYDQCTKLANVFFILVGLMEQIPGVSPVGRYITLVPLAFIMSVSAVKEVVEDLKRRKSDRVMNSHPCEIFRQYWQRYTWSAIRVGDLVRVSAGQTFPSDMILVCTSEPSQSCYIQTASLDGENNYKIRQCRPEFALYENEDQWLRTKAIVECEEPDVNLYKFNATIKFDDKEEFPININQVILRGSQLKNTKWVVGIVVYTGHQTKIMLNASKPPIKRSSVDYTTNWLVLVLMVVLMLMTIVCAAIYDVYLHEVIPTHWYLGVESKQGITFHLSIITFFILFHNIIPISLMVTLEIVKTIQSFVTMRDPMLYSKFSGSSVIVKTSSIIEELGQINYIFTDKTGTLTCNDMVLRKLSIGCHTYEINGGISTLGVEQAFAPEGRESFEIFMINLLLCNSIVAETSEDNSTLNYQSSSPDETAIITALASHGYKFISRDSKGITFQIRDEIQCWKVVCVFEFSSTRKRMSVLAESPTGERFLFCKGADCVIMERLSTDNDGVYENTMTNLEVFAKDGLRTLCIAYRKISSEEFEQFSREMARVESQIIDREAMMDRLAEVVEKNLVLLGVTGIEDQLQPDVSETISTLMSAQIRICMLTGDKLETAINIGYSCNLLSMSTDVRVLNCCSVEHCSSILETIQREKNIVGTPRGRMRTLPQFRTDLALVVSGQDLFFAMDQRNVELFLDVALHCKAVICCRASPLQKKAIVHLFKDRVYGVSTLAVGDGGNDCSMIRAANVGVGIIGKEGMQAANTADFAIGEFSHLSRLLLVHGAATYRRICNCIYFCFYKNIVFNILHFFYDFYNLFSGKVIFSKISIALFNVCYTSLPPFVFGLLDKSCSSEAHSNVPYLYESLRKSSPFGLRRFIYWLLNGILHSSLLFYFTYAAFNKGVISFDGQPMSIAVFGNVMLAHTIMVITLKAAIELRSWFFISHLGIWGGLVFFYISLTLFCRRVPYFLWFEPDFLDADRLMYRSPLFWLSLGIPFMVLLPDFIFHCIRNTWFIPSHLLVSEMERSRQINWSEPENIKNVQSTVKNSTEIKSHRTKKYFGFAFSIAENVNLARYLPSYTYCVKSHPKPSLDPAL